ncbi:3'-5' exonuclease [Psychromicrobium lacuslunae]|uniref:DNA polymerase III subunit epsilon n=1 Tax=Psychromicrobium lacuslunae TaxID=1618207 RepID=A0A0D4BZ02_9MICC|nr:3'-5' exonuclease [Psychromicrobium lacuslunae]AJT41524.1 DNA polymerase III subunit epsilon [Psychromicrobium lacuslunae]
MNSWLAGPRAAFDLETTGRNPLTARLVTASVVLLDANEAILASHEWLADPGVEIPAEATAIHGISTDHARAEGQPATQVLGELSTLLANYFAQQIPVIGFNACYDFSVLKYESARHGLAEITALPVIDPFILDKQVDRFRKGKRTLVACCEHYHIPLLAAHTSAADALAAARLATAIARQYPELQLPATQLHQEQVKWAAAQAQNFQDFLREQGRHDAVIDGTWPVAR